jgi:glycerol-3-phosphate dehydrogenase
MYDILAGKANMESSYVLGKGKALEAFPMLKADGLRGAVVYYDGELSFLSFLFFLVVYGGEGNAIAGQQHTDLPLFCRTT